MPPTNARYRRIDGHSADTQLVKHPHFTHFPIAFGLPEFQLNRRKSEFERNRLISPIFAAVIWEEIEVTALKKESRI